LNFLPLVCRFGGRRHVPDSDSSARRTIAGLQPKRAQVILAGACIVRTVMEKLGKQSFTVSDRGLRHGVLAERFGA
jgi:exopolyphosphatase/guanosine-5'-triphosphate,3'-diphosphate pyrophosphatase